jgi:hypothetical protein
MPKACLGLKGFIVVVVYSQKKETQFAGVGALRGWEWSKFSIFPKQGQS